MLNYIDGPCGSGKTYAIANFIAQNKHKARFIIAQPKNANLLETEKLLKSNGLNPYVKDIDHCNEGEVVRDIIAYINSNNHEFDDVLLVTHTGILTAYSRISEDQKKKYVLFFDEVTNVTGELPLRVTAQRKMLSDNISLKDPTQKFTEVVAKNTTALNNYAKTAEGKDAVNDIFGKVSEMILDEDTVVEVESEAYKNIKRDGFHFYYHIKPDKFTSWREVYFMSACFCESLIYKIWSKHYGFSFVKKDITLRYKSHTNVSNTKIHFFMDRDYSKRLGHSDDYAIHNQMVDIINKDILKGQSSLTVLNNSINTDVDGVPVREVERNIRIPDNTTVISSYVHGLNQYQNLHNISFLASLNMRPTYESYLQNRFNLKPKEVEEAFLFASTYQAVCRISIRNPADNSERHICVPDSRSALYLEKMLPHVTLESHENKMQLPEAKESGRPALGDKAMTQAERNEQKKERKRIIKECEEWEDIKKSYAEIIDKKETTKVVAKLDFEDADELIKYFEKESQFTSNDKHTVNRLLWPAVVDTDPMGEGGTRFGKNNVIASCFLMLDKDEGHLQHDMTADDFRMLFPDTKMAIYQTYSGAGNYRVVIPLTQPITGEAFEILCRSIAMKCFNAGYRDKANSLPFDRSKFNCASKFYLPNHAPGTEMDFRKYDGKIFDPIKALNQAYVDPAIKAQPMTPEQRREAQKKLQDTLSAHGQGQQQFIQEKLDGFGALSDGMGRHGKFFGLGVTLANHGFDEAGIRGALAAVPYQGLTQRDKDRKIKSIIKSLRGKGLI
ncbi:hypothetical protein [Novacetimonas hansenii]